MRVVRLLPLMAIGILLFAVPILGQTVADRPPSGAQTEFKTDFSKHSVPYTEILSGGPPKDGIPAINTPNFISVAEADTWLKPKEPVVLFRLADDIRAYPIQILMWHEIVNDVQTRGVQRSELKPIVCG